MTVELNNGLLPNDFIQLDPALTECTNLSRASVPPNFLDPLPTPRFDQSRCGSTWDREAYFSGVSPAPLHSQRAQFFGIADKRAHMVCKNSKQQVNVRISSGKWVPLPPPFKVIQGHRNLHGSAATYDFLLVIHSNQWRF